MDSLGALVQTIAFDVVGVAFAAAAIYCYIVGKTVPAATLAALAAFYLGTKLGSVTPPGTTTTSSTVTPPRP